MHEDDEEQQPGQDGPPRPIGEIKAALDKIPTETHDEFVRNLTEVETIGEIQSAIERSRRPV